MSQSIRTEELLSRHASDSSIISRLGPGRVAIIVDTKETRSQQLQLLLTFAVNLLSRLFPVVRQLEIEIRDDVPLNVRLPRWCKKTLSGSIVCFLQELSAPIGWRVAPKLNGELHDVVLAIGHTDRQADVYVGSHGWVAEVSAIKSVDVEDEFNPIGAYTAAAFAAAEVWKRLLSPIVDLLPGLPVGLIRETLTFSAFDYRDDDLGLNPELPSCLDLGHTTFAGQGTGGAAAAWTLASLREVRGAANLIEPDHVTDSNLNRLVAASASDALADRPKVEVVSNLFHAHTALSVREFALPFDEVVSELKRDELRHVVAAVHSRAARRSIQMETPEVLWDAAATETGEFYVWRVAFGRTQCLACRFSEDRDPEFDQARQLARLLGYEADFWLAKIRDNAAFSVEEVSELERRMSELQTNASAPGIGQRFGDWEVEQCGKLQLPDPDDEIPTPFAPVLAGVLLAGEIIKEHLFPDDVLHSCYWNTIVGHFMQRKRPTAPMRRQDCPLCGDSVLLEQYRRRWGKKRIAVAD